MKPALVIATYNRPEVLRRLLNSISRGVYPYGVPLIISVDFGSGNRKDVLKVAHEFEWTNGEKLIIEHEKHLGINPHTFFIGSLANKYGSIIRFEDDYYVSPMFYKYASEALDFYADDIRIAGVSIYTVWFNGVTKEPFIPYLDESDVYFVQSSWSHGQAFSAAQWEAYVSWYRQHDPAVTADDPLHESWSKGDDQEWFTSAAKYLVETNRFYVFPRDSLCTNFGDPGIHFRKPSRYFQVPLQTRKTEFHFKKLDDSIAVYDAFQEMLPDRLVLMRPDLAGYDLELDLNGTKARSKLRRSFVITSQPCVSPVKTWGLMLYPREANIVEEIPGTEFKLCRAADLRPGGFGGLLAAFHQYEYARSRLSVGISKHLLYWTIRQLEYGLNLFRKITRH